MKYQLFKIPPGRKLHQKSRRIGTFGMVLAQVVLLGLGSVVSSGQDNQDVIDDEGAQVLTRGPVHEAFAGIVSYNPEPGIIVDRAPPEAIEELPPSERPEGDNISWIPGYWAWDDERSDYLWVSGTWRALPPGREWTTGYWGRSGGGYQWTSGYWADASESETTYLPAPPETVEVGPNVEAPSRDHVWSPGSWTWQQERYAWSPGYWAEGRNDWDWTPPHYVYTPRGHVYVGGFWDYNVQRRGVLYAPVQFQAGYYSRPGYQYSPVVAIGLAALVDHLFLRPKYHHYYFGDYYDRRYADNGYFSPHVYQSRRFGYDPVYSYQRWTHRQDNDWERRHLASYDYRRDHESARPPRTWNDQRRMKMDNMDEKDRRNYRMGATFDQMAKNSDNSMRVQTVSANERQKLSDQSREVRKNRDQRREVEAEGAKNSGDKSERDRKPSKVKRSASPIVGKSPDQFSGAQAPPKVRRPQNDNKQDPSDRKTNKGEDRSITGKEERSTRRDADTKDNQPPQRKPNQDKDRPDNKKDESTPRRDTDKEPDRRPNPDRADRPDNQKDSSTPRRDDSRTVKPDREPNPGREDRPDNKKGEPNPRRDTDKEPERRPNPDRTDRSDSKKESSSPRRDEGARARQPDRDSNPNKSVRPEPKKESSSPRRETEAKEPVRKARQESNRKDGDSSANGKEQRKPNQPDVQSPKGGNSPSGKKSVSDKEDAELSEEKARRKK